MNRPGIKGKPFIMNFEEKPFGWNMFTMPMRSRVGVFFKTIFGIYVMYSLKVLEDPIAVEDKFSYPVSVKAKKFYFLWMKVWTHTYPEDTPNTYHWIGKDGSIHKGEFSRKEWIEFRKLTPANSVTDSDSGTKQ